MNYITHKRFKSKAICGDVNIPAKTECKNREGVIFCGEIPICYDTSENAHQYFARNDDGNGMLRGRLTQAIQKTLSRNDEAHQERWDKVWADEVCQAYKRKEFSDYWLWNHDFYNAEIMVLQHIATVVGVKEV